MAKTNGKALTARDLRDYWEQHFPACPPIGYILRQQLHNCWFRIHTLPDAKRYAESNREEIEILRRHNSLLSSILGDGGKYVLITTGYSDTETPVRSYPELESVIPNSKHWFSFALHKLEEEDDPNYWHFYFSAETWAPQSANRLLKFIARGVIANVLFLVIDQNCIYHPYDGGADIFVQSESLKTRLKQQYKSWLSTHPRGL